MTWQKDILNDSFCYSLSDCMTFQFYGIKFWKQGEEQRFAENVFKLFTHFLDMQVHVYELRKQFYCVLH